MITITYYMIYYFFATISVPFSYTKKATNANVCCSLRYILIMDVSGVTYVGMDLIHGYVRFL